MNRISLNSAFFVLVIMLFLFPAALRAAETPALTSHSHPPITVTAPSFANDGTAFPCTFVGGNLQSVSVEFLKKKITANTDAIAESSGNTEHRFTFLLPVPLDSEKGLRQIFWTATFMDGSTLQGAAPVFIQKRRYPVQKLTVAPQYVTPDPELKERIAREQKQLREALVAWSAKRCWPLPWEGSMTRPVSGKVTSLYGLRRMLNDEPRAPHKGVDFRAAAGTPIKAVADGTVVLAGDFYYPGKFVVVDHGLGVVSISMHMSEIVAVKGQVVKSGDVVGLVGSTGRSTGPHLHLGLSVLGESVDPLPLLAATAEDKALYTQPENDGAQKKTGKKSGKASTSKAAAQKKSVKKPVQKKE